MISIAHLYVVYLARFQQYLYIISLLIHIPQLLVPIRIFFIDKCYICNKEPELNQGSLIVEFEAINLKILQSKSDRTLLLNIYVTDGHGHVTFVIFTIPSFFRFHNLYYYLLFFTILAWCPTRF